MLSLQNTISFLNYTLNTSEVTIIFNLHLFLFFQINLGLSPIDVNHLLQFILEHYDRFIDHRNNRIIIFLDANEELRYRHRNDMIRLFNSLLPTQFTQDFLDTKIKFIFSCNDNIPLPMYKLTSLSYIHDGFFYDNRFFDL